MNRGDAMNEHNDYEAGLDYTDGAYDEAMEAWRHEAALAEAEREEEEAKDMSRMIDINEIKVAFMKEMAEIADWVVGYKGDVSRDALISACDLAAHNVYSKMGAFNLPQMVRGHGLITLDTVAVTLGTLIDSRLLSYEATPTYKAYMRMAFPHEHCDW
jgi:hypothetical protein